MKKPKRFGAALLTLALLLSLLPAWPAAAGYAFSGGSGTAEDPYLIATAEDLKNIKDEYGIHYLQVADLDLAGLDWGSSNRLELGSSSVYDGGCYRILNFHTTMDGLFDTNAGTIRNVILEQVSVCVRSTTGITVGTLVNTNRGRVENCTVQGTVTREGSGILGGIVGANQKTVIGCTLEEGSSVTSTYKFADCVGGIVGDSSGDITDCHNLGETVSCGQDLDVSGNRYAGGVAGKFSGEMTGCTNASDVFGTHAGGMVGFANVYYAPPLISGCRNDGDVQGVYAGGILSMNYGISVENCENAGRCEGTSYAGGIVGIAPYNETSTLRCRNTGDVLSQDNAGGIMGSASSGSVVGECVNLGTVKGTDAGGIAGNFGGDALTGCYNRGSVCSVAEPEINCGAGGIVGYGRNVQSCYNTGAVEKTGGAPLGEIVGSGYQTVARDSFWMEPGTVGAAAGKYNEAENCEALSEAAFTDGTALTKLNQSGEGEWYPDLAQVNGGCPVPAWQCEAACVQADKEPGLYAASFTVTLTALEDVQQIFYRLGEEGAWLTYSQPVSISQDCTLQAYAQYEAGNSPVTSFAYQLASYPVEVGLNAPGTYSDSVAVELSCPSAPAGSPIWYTTDGSDPTDESNRQRSQYISAMVLQSSATIRAAAQVNGEYGDILSFDYVISPAITADPGAGAMSGPVDVTLSCAKESFSIYYTLTGADPRKSGRLYTGTPIPVFAATQLKAVPYRNGGWGTVTSFSYDIPQPELTVSHGAGEYGGAFYLTLSCAMEGVEIYTDLGGSFQKYEAPLPIWESTDLQVQLRYKGQVMKTETLSYALPDMAVIADPAPGTMNGRIQVSLSCAVGGLELRYTLDGSAPTADSPLYQQGQPIPIVRTSTLKVGAFLPGGQQAVWSEAYDYKLNLPEVTASPAPGSYDMPFEVILSISKEYNDGTFQIYYTTDGSDPADSQTARQGNTVTVEHSLTIRAVPISTEGGITRYGAESVFIYQAQTYSLSVSEAAHGTVTGTPAGSYEAGTTITLTARAEEGYYFERWQSSGITLADPSAPSISFAMPAMAVTVTPVFRKEMPAAGTNGLFQGEIGQADENAILISTPEQLAAIGQDPAYPLSGSYLLVADLDLSDYGNWTPIGGYQGAFSGTFDGYGHVISGLTYHDLTGYAGLFGRVSATGVIKNLGLEQVSITVDDGGVMGSCYVGGIAGQMGGNTSSSAEMYNCYVTGSITAKLESGNLYIGGLAGELDADVSDCFNLATLTGQSGSSDTMYMGGVAGMIDTYLPEPYVVERCFNSGTLSPSSTTNVVFVGGVVGYLSNSVTFRQCYNTADVWISPRSYRGASAYLGGIAGFASSDISDCYNQSDVGVGAPLSTPYTYQVDCGGIVGQFVITDGKDHRLDRCHTTGKVLARAAGKAYAGGIIGEGVCNNYDLEVHDSMINLSSVGVIRDFISGTGSSGPFQAAVVCSTIPLYGKNYFPNTLQNSGNFTLTYGAYSVGPEYMVKQSFYEDKGWSFDGDWVMDPAQNGGMPYFRWQTGGYCIMSYSGGAAQLYCGMEKQQVVLLAAAYDDSGKALESACIQGTLTPGISRISLPLTQQGKQIKVFLLEADTLKPLAHSVTILQ